MTSFSDRQTIQKILEEGIELNSKQQYEEAIAKFRELLEISPSNIRARRELGILYKKQNRIEEAIECWEKLIELQPKRGDFYSNLAHLLLVKEDKEQLKTICERAVELEPKQPLWMYEECKHKGQKELLEEAEKIYLESLELRAKQPVWLFLSLGAIFKRQYKLDRALDIYQQGREIYPKNVQFYVNLSKIYSKQRNWDKAIELCQQIIAIRSNPIAYIQLGGIYQELEELDKAIEAYNEALKLVPKGMLSIYTGLGDCYRKQNKWQQAIDNYEKAIPLTLGKYGEKDIHSKIQSLYLQQGKPQEAKEQYKLKIISGSIVDRKHKIIYCPTAKNACTLFKSAIVEQSDDREKYQKSNLNIHTYASDLKDTGVSIKSFDLFEDENYFKFAIVRNPFDRLVSAYLDKIVKHPIPEEFAIGLIYNAQKKLGIKIDLERSISFAELIRYLMTIEDYLVNEHWRSQYYSLGLGLFKLDYIGQFEKLEEVITFLENKFNFKIKTNVSKNHNQGDHKTKYIRYDREQKFHTMYPQKLREQQEKDGGFPSTENFYTSEIIDLVKIRFYRDIQLYQTLFNTNTEEAIDY